MSTVTEAETPGSEPRPSVLTLDQIACPDATVAVVGLGYVGLPTALALAGHGIRVIGYDVSESRLVAIKTRHVDLLEVDQARLGGFLGSDRFFLTTEARALADADAVIVCVPTPVDHHLVPDLTALSAACAAVVEHARPGQTIVLTSTTYVGCTRELLVSRLEDRGLVVGDDIFVAFSPERINPGVAEHRPERTPRVVGGVTEECTRRAVDILAWTASDLHAVSSPEAAELTKLLENTFRAVNIALANEFAGIARQFDVNAIEVIRAAATKPYGFMPFYPGPGVGGHCIPCDPHYLLWQLKAHRLPSPVTEAAMASIAARPQSVVARAREVLAGAGRTLAGARVLVVGMAYKAAVADVRESPALEIAKLLQESGSVVGYTDSLVPSVRTPAGELHSEPVPTAHGWDLVIVHTVHPGVDHSWIREAPLVLDATYGFHDARNRHVL